MVSLQSTSLDFKSRNPDGLNLVKYEDMINDRFKILKSIFSEWHLDNSTPLVERIIEETSFESMSGGRVRGSENIDSFQRKGIVGDWLNHFQEGDKDIFKEQGGDMLIELGYEKDKNW